MNVPLPQKQKKFSLKKFLKKLPWRAIFSLLLSFAAAAFGVYLGYRDVIVTPVSTAQFPYDVNDKGFVPGNVVAVKENGYLTRNTGTTVYKNEYLFHNHVMLNLQSISITDDIIACVYHGGLMVVKFNQVEGVLFEKRFTLPPIQIGKPRQIDRAVGFKNTNFFVVVGSAEILPVTVVERDNDVDVIWGDEVVYYQSPLELMPEITATSDGRISILFTDNDYNIRLVTAKADLSSHTVEITSSDFVTFNTYPYAISYIQNGLLAITFADNNNQTSTSMINTIIGHEVFENGKLIRVDLHESVTIPTSSTINYLDIDSWHVFAENNTEMILAYITEDESDGLSILNINYNEARDTLVIGPRILNKNSGTSDIDTHGIHHLAILMLKSRKFIVYYSSILTNGFTALQVGYLSPALELVTEGPQYIISRGVSTIKKEYYYVSATEVGNRVFLLECLYKLTSIDTSFNILDIYSQPVGIIQELKDGIATVVTQGVVTIPFVFDLKPGKYYYGSSRGSLIEGEWMGQRGVNGYYIYIENNEEKVLSNVYNRVGFAISNNQFMVLPKQQLQLNVC